MSEEMHSAQRFARMCVGLQEEHIAITIEIFLLAFPIKIVNSASIFILIILQGLDHLLN